MRVSGSKGLAHDYDDNDYSKREQRDETTGRRGDYTPRQESLLQVYVIVCVTITTIVWRRKSPKRDRQWLQEIWRLKEKGATTTLRLGWLQWLRCCRIDYRRGLTTKENNDIVGRRHQTTDWRTSTTTSVLFHMVAELEQRQEEIQWLLESLE